MTTECGEDEDMETVKVYVPTGAAGNITGGLWARTMGVPVELHSAVNRNNIFH